MITIKLRTLSNSKSLKSFFVYIIAIGLFIQLSGNIWLPSGSSHAAQINLWFMIPTLLFLTFHLKHIKSIIKSKEEILVIAYVFWFMLSASWSTSENPDVIVTSLRYGLYVLVYLAGINVIYSHKPEYFTRSIDAAIAIVAFGALVTFYIQIPTPDMNLSFRHLRIHEMGLGDFAKFSHPIQAANYFGAFCIIAFARMLAQNSKGKAAFFFLTSCIFAFYVYLTGSRGPVAGVIFALIVTLATMKPRLIIPSCIVSVVAIAVLITFTTDVTHINSLFSNFDRFMAAITNQRWFAWEHITSDVLSNHPLIGYGADAQLALKNSSGNFTYYHPHSGFVLVTYETGIIGLLLFCAAMASLISVASSLLDRKFIRMSIGLLAFCFIAMVTDVHKIVTRPHEYWVFIWLPVGIILSTKRLEDN